MTPILFFAVVGSVLITLSTSSVAEGADCTPAWTATSEDFKAWVGRVVANQETANVQVSKAVTVDPLFQSNASTAATGFVVDKSGAGNFVTVQAAVDAVPENNGQRITITIQAGYYFEKVFVPSNKPYVTFQGAGAGVTTIAYSDTAASADSTQNSASVAVTSNGFIARDITFTNTAPAPAGGAVGAQAVAFRISGDQAAFYRCSFYGAQDTLYDQRGRHYFSNCFIQGSIDWIFGDGQSYYEGCQLNSIANAGQGSVTAQKRGSNSDTAGFAFVHCTITGSGPIYLGRAWGPYSRVVFAYTDMANLIIPEGWNNFGDTTRQLTVYYGQYMCTGPGAAEGGRVAWSHELSPTEASAFTSLNFVDGATWVTG